MNYDKDPDDLHGDDVVAEIRICIRRNGSMSTAGCIENEAVALAMIDNARDAIKNHNARKRINGGGTLIVPARDCPPLQ